MWVEEPMNGISKFTLIIMILWTFFWIAVGAQGTVTGIVVYLFVGLPSTLFGWFLWWTLHPEEKPARTPQHKSIQPTGRQRLLQAQSQSSKPPKAKKKNDVMHYLRCKHCHLEEFLENEADGQQSCTKCGWKKQ
jgi:hypothetical protein